MAAKRTRIPKERPPDPHGVDIDWRIFIALPLPEAVQQLAGDLTARLAGHGWPVRWVDAASLHITLHFLGETPPERAELLRLALPKIVANQPSFTLVTDSLGLFPDERDPRVIWLGVGGETDRLRELRDGIGRALAKLEFPVEADRFHPHITLGRLREQPSPADAKAIVAAIRDPGLAPVLTPPIPIAVDAVHLVRSIPERGAHRYEMLGRARLVQGAS